jgi:hypothetical protein
MAKEPPEREEPVPMDLLTRAGSIVPDDPSLIEQLARMT